MSMIGATVPPQAKPPPPAAQNVQQRFKPEDAATHITVSDPVQHSEGVNKYTSYRVDVRPQGNDLSQTQAFSAVLRRYSDFVWLFEKFHDERAGAIVPPLPEKKPTGRFNPQFIEDRRRSLERFLRRVSVHPELQDCSCLDTFLRADDVTFHAAKHSKNNVLLQQSTMMGSMVPGAPPQLMPKPKKEGFKRWFAETKTSISGDLVRSPDDELFEEIQRYVHGLDSQMKNVQTQASALVRKGKEIANGLFEFGLAFNLLGQSEADALGDALGKVGETADRLSVLSAEHSDREAAEFEDPLVDIIKTIHSVKMALQKRHEKRLTYSTCLQSVESKQHSLAKMRAQIGMEAKAYGTEMSLRRAQDNAELARDDFAATSQRVLREVDRFKRETAEDMRRTVLEYIRMQVDYNKRMEEIWAALIPQLERVQLDGDSNVVGEVSSPTNAAGAAAQNSASMIQPSQPAIHSQPMVPNPQQAMPPTMGSQLYSNTQPPAPQDPGSYSMQYRN